MQPSLNRTLLIVDDESLLRRSIGRFFRNAGYTVIEAEDCAGTRSALADARPDVVIVDHNLPDGTALDLLKEIREVSESIPVIVLTGHGSIDLAVRAVKEGAEQFLTKPVETSALKVVVERAVENQRNRQSQLVAGKERKGRVDPFAGGGAAMQQLADQAKRVVRTDCPILLTGETGVGKGVLARWLHDHGLRSREPIVDINCASLSKDLLESELFGHERGAFTGAVSTKTGLFECAHRGTLFLDEIGDMDLQIQPKLLKVLEDRRFRRVGDIRDRYCDVRIIAATHQDLQRLIQDGKFRSDLYFRINTVILHVPPLRQRREDIPQLAKQILRSVAADLGRLEVSFDESAVEALIEHDWLGNVRELRNVIERAVLLSGSMTLDRTDIRFERTLHNSDRFPDGGLSLRDVEEMHIRRVLERENGNVQRAAKKLKIPRSTLYQKIKELNLIDPSPESSRRL